MTVMNARMRRILWAGMLLGISALASALPVAWDAPDSRWLTRESAHFLVHYPEPLEALALRSLAIAEQVHEDLVPFFGRAPQQRTELVLVDDFDYSNGWATPLPFNQIRLYVSPAEDVQGLEHMDEWLHGLIRHEYVHTLHMDMAAGLPEAGRSLLGRFVLLFPHLFTPSMMTEGLAVWLETSDELGYGRLDGSFYAMQMRAELAANGGDGLSQVVVPLRDWPRGKQYLYGAYFMQWLARTQGEERLQQYLQRYSRQLLPYLLQNHVARQVFGASWPVLWRDYRRWLQQVFTLPPQEAVEGQRLPGIPDGQQVTASGGTGFWQVRANGEDRPALLHWQEQQQGWQQGWQPHTQTAVKQVLDLDSAADGTLAMTRLIPQASGRELADVFLWSERSGWQRLTQGMRLRKVRWQPGGQQLLASRKWRGLSELWQLDRQGGMTLLWQSEAQDVLGAFDISPDGRTLVAALKRSGQGWNLEAFDLNSRQWRPLTDTRATEHQPEFQPDGRLLFSADYDGTFNIYRLDLQQAQTEQLTRVATGAFQPRWVQDGVLYQRYSSEGYQLFWLAQPATLQLDTLEGRQGRYDYPPLTATTAVSEARPYQAWPGLLPRYWFPLYSSDEVSRRIGFTTSGSDAIGRHSYALNVLWDQDYGWAEGALLYQYDNRWQGFWQRSHRFLEVAGLGTAAIREDLVSVQRDHLWNALEDQLQLHLGLSVDDNRFVRLPDGAIPVRSSFREGLAGVALSFDNREFYRNVPGTGWGSYATLVYESNDVIASDLRGGQWQASVLHTADLPGRSTLTLGLAAGYGDAGTEPFVLGGSALREDGLLFGRDEFSLPGYSRAVQSGQRYYNTVLRLNGWLARIERNWGLLPLGLGDLDYGLWVQSASAWWPQQEAGNLTAIGAELGVELVLGYNLILPFRLGIAQGLDRDAGETQAYLRLRAPF